MTGRLDLLNEPLTLHANRLADKVVFVTGASTGIGAAAVRLFAAEGARVVAASRRTDKIEAVVADVRAAGGEATAIACDVKDEASVAAAVERTVQIYGGLHGAFNNAERGGGQQLLHQTPTDLWDDVIATNLRGPFLCMKHEIPAMLASGGGSIVNTSSIGGLKGGARNTDYGTSKWGLHGMTKGAALAYWDDGIRVNALAPGATHSEMFDLWMSYRAHTEQITKDEAYASMGGVALADDQARAALFLLSDESRWITGVVLSCDGGASAS